MNAIAGMMGAMPDELLDVSKKIAIILNIVTHAGAETLRGVKTLQYGQDRIETAMAQETKG